MIEWFIILDYSINFKSIRLKLKTIIYIRPSKIFKTNFGFEQCSKTWKKFFQIIRQD